MSCKRNPSGMTTQEIERELENFEWEYIALSDRAQTGESYRQGSKELDERKAALEAELQNRNPELCPACQGARYIDGSSSPCPECNNPDDDGDMLTAASPEP